MESCQLANVDPATSEIAEVTSGARRIRLQDRRGVIRSASRPDGFGDEEGGKLRFF